MKFFSLILLANLILAKSSLAARSLGTAKSNPSKIQIIQMDSDFDVSQLKGSGIQIHQSDSQPIPSLLDRNKILTQSLLNSDTSDWDQYDKDKLVFMAIESSTADLGRLYPQLNPDNLKKLKLLVVRYEPKP